MRSCRAQALGGLVIPRRRKHAGDPASAAAGPVRQRSASTGGRARRALTLLAVSGLLGLSGVVVAGTSPAPASSFTVDLNASYQNSIASTVPVGQAVTLTATTDQDVQYTPYYIDVYDLTTATLMIQCPMGVSCPISVAQSVASTHIYVAYVAGWDPERRAATPNPGDITGNRLHHVDEFRLPDLAQRPGFSSGRQGRDLLRHHQRQRPCGGRDPDQ